MSQTVSERIRPVDKARMARPWAGAKKGKCLLADDTVAIDAGAYPKLIIIHLTSQNFHQKMYHLTNH
jgi:hypothetical protein